MIGKLLGAMFGFAWFGWLGALLGLYIGHLFDKGMSQNFNTAGHSQRQAQVQKAFFRVTFLVMGRIAKADGRVSKDEIQWAEFVMNRMNLHNQHRQEAINLFNKGKDGQFDLNAELAEFRRLIGRNANLTQMFLEIQLQAAYADGDLSQAEQVLLNQVCQGLGISAMRFEMIHARVRAERAFTAGGGYQGAGGPGSRPASRNQLAEAYKVLGVQSSASDGEVKKAYRRLMSQHHPDKLVAKGLPEEMMKLAKEKTQEIQAAYELIKKHREKQ